VLTGSCVLVRCSCYGRAANAQAQLKFTDEGVCRDYLCGLCPHDLYANTKFDLGKCPKAHNEHQKEAYEEASKTQDYGFEREWLETLERLLRERDKYIAYEIREVEERENRGMDPVVKDLVSDAWEDARAASACADDLTLLAAFCPMASQNS